MTLFLADDAVMVMDDGEHLAVRQGGRVEVWDFDGERCLGYLPEAADENTVRVAIQFYDVGHAAGERSGVIQAQGTFRRALGLAGPQAWGTGQ